MFRIQFASIRNLWIPILVASGILAASPCVRAGAPNTPVTVQFNEDIRPILTSRCFLCHGPDPESREADLRLDNYEGATDWVIDLDDADESELLARVTSDDPDEVMPPAGHGDPLSAEEVELLRAWIKSGAHYDKHWSYQNPKHYDVPTVEEVGDGDESHAIRPVNEIDKFVFSRLSEEKLSPSRAADRYTIIRRVALDVTGLPPTAEEVAKFINDDTSNAYERMVDDYLSRNAYGERWAAVWLDLARYADSAGFSGDARRKIWLFRDYVIRAYVENKPFDRFTLEQIAGDLLEDADMDTRIATAFHRNTLTNSEGGTDDEEFRSAAVVDRVNTTMSVWMGTTMACAQCHTHKYDPITQAEYFQFYDFFNQTADSDKEDDRPLLKIYAEGVEEQREKLSDRIAAKKKQLDDPASEEAFEAWLATMRDSMDASDIKGQFVRVELPFDDKRLLSLAEVQVLSTDSDGQRQNVALKGKATQSSTGFEGLPEYAIDGNTDGEFDNQSVSHTEGEPNPWWQVDLGKDVSIEEIAIWNRTDGSVSDRLDGYRLSVLDKHKNVVWTRDVAKASKEVQTSTIQQFPADIAAIIKAGDAFDEEQLSRIQAEHQHVVRAKRVNELAKIERDLDKLKPLTTVPIMMELPEEDLRTTKIQIRGSYLMTGDTVSAATPAALHKLPTDETPNRLALAKWLVAKDNPLAARVVVNRYWEQLFGIGLVATSEDFGSQGEQPSHPQLLDWLAIDLVENGWDTKQLLKKIVMSATYRQSSVATAESLTTDPYNRLMGRGPRVRLTAEMIRDQALAVSGLLSRKMYGPSVQPPQPKVGLKPAFTGETTDWVDSTGEDRYRRALYTEWRRSAPYPSLTTFDMNNREVCEVRRTSTNTPLQALVTLNDPVYVEAAQAFAKRVVTSTAGESDEDAVTFAFQRCLIRPPSDLERSRLVDFVKTTRAHFKQDAEAANQLAVDPLNPPDEDADHVELATWTATANILLNLDETLMKP